MLIDKTFPDRVFAVSPSPDRYSNLETKTPPHFICPRWDLDPNFATLVAASLSAFSLQGSALPPQHHPHESDVLLHPGGLHVDLRVQPSGLC
jgi:hypothetical protein